MTTRRAISGLVIGLLLAILGAAVWSEGVELASTSEACTDEESKDYPRLEAAAQDVLGAVGDEFQRYSSCEDTGRPGAALRVAVYDWDSRSQAWRFFHGASFALDSNPPMLSIDGLQVNYRPSVSYLQNDGRRFIEVSFAPS